jgi:hypothetical protein
MRETLFPDWGGLLLVYFVLWTLLYVSVNGSDFSNYLGYVRLVWTGRAGEIPTLISLYSIIGTIIFGVAAALFAWAVKKMRARRNQ